MTENLTEAMKQTRIKFLVEEITKHNKAYWEDNDPLIADADYDQLVESLRLLDPTNPLTHQIESAQGTVDHTDMLSLDKAYTIDSVKAWMKKVARTQDEVFILEPKYDGVASKWDKLSGQLVTRGGEDITRHLGTMEVFFNPAEQSDLALGEVVMLKSVFSTLNGEYKNPRAAASGLLNRKDALPKELLHLILYEHDQETFKLSDFDLFDWPGVIEDYQNKDYPADGLVFKLADREYAASLGNTEHHPLGALALKFPNPQARTVLTDVIWQVGKNCITPVGVVEPTTLSGTTVTRVTLHNLREIRRHDLHIGDEIILERAGDVIPHMLRVSASHKHVVISAPTECPVCLCDVRYQEPRLFCTNDACPGKAAVRLQASFKDLDMDGFGPVACDLLVLAGYSLADVFTKGLPPAFTGKKRANLETAILRRRTSPLNDYVLIAAMNIPGVGQSMAKEICDKVSIPELMENNCSIVPAALGKTYSKMPEILLKLRTLEFTDLLLSLNIVSTKGQLSRPTICFTGAEPGGMSRGELVAKAEKAGYAYKNSVVKNLTVLVASETGTTKAKKAQQYGTEVWTYEHFLEVVDKNI